MDIFESTWKQAWSNLGLTPPAGLMVQLMSAYREPQRHYHTLEHLKECLEHFERVKSLSVHPGEVAIALWFHDAVYDVRAHGNEQSSANWALRALAGAGAGEATSERVEQLIMATCHDAAPAAGDAQLLVDMDLAILGATPERFAQYDEQIRREYSWVPNEIYKVKRAQVLEAFLNRPAVFCTDHFKQLLESQARANLSGVCGFHNTKRKQPCP